MDYAHYIERKNEMEFALLQQLYKEKRAATWRPAASSALGVCCMLPVSIVGFGVTTLLPPAQQALALWPLMETINKAGDLLQTSATSIYNSLIPPNDPLLILEIEFAKRLPYATKDERELIISLFAAERASRSYQTRELRMRIGLIKPKIKQPHHFDSEILSEDNAPAEQNKILVHLREYFANYLSSDDARNKIAGAVTGYVAKLKENRDTGAYTILLQGAFGTGKSHFAKSLGEFLTSLFPDGFPFELVSYTSEEDLLGTEDNPGALLTALSKMNKEYGIIFLDEGNLENLDSIAKLLFDTAGTEYPYPFLRGATRSLKNYLVIVCSNKTLEDPAIASRVVKVDFPTPTSRTIRSVIKFLLRNALPNDISEEDLEVYFNSSEIQNLCLESKHLRLRDKINECIATIQMKRLEEISSGERQDYIARLTAQYGTEVVRSVFFKNLLSDYSFWEQSEEIKLKLLIDAYDKRDLWLKKWN